MAQHVDTHLQYEIKVKHPKKYKVFLLNDDYSSMDFVVDILMTVFHKSYIEAEAIMIEVHQKERGICGVYTHEIAETKVMQVHKRARENGFPLKATMEEE
ncbi:MAG: ATP-dependent Clp protease adaptor ClpS [Sulfurimonadaceae bacterium]|jgi:ATP-dependent Clp protease adaptor protein ClpS|nr:ATP-dependent Clp protease adaptor ClpS [Sulfurimonadaceae bacterium]